MISLDGIILSEYPDDEFDKVFEKLRTHDFHKPIAKVIQLLNEHLRKKDEESELMGTIHITHIAAAILIKVNEYFKSLADSGQEEEKILLQDIIGSIFRTMLQWVCEEVHGDHKNQFILNMYSSLYEVCSIWDYDFSELFYFLGIEELAKSQIEQSNPSEEALIHDETVEVPNFFFDDDDDKFLEALEKTGIFSRAELEGIGLLIDRPDTNLEISFSITNRVPILQFFAWTNESGLLQNDACRGFYQVLSFHVVDFDEKFLRGKPAHRIIANLKRRKTYAPLSARLQKLFVRYL